MTSIVKLINNRHEQRKGGSTP